jgi:hypothetical protein
MGFWGTTEVGFSFDVKTGLKLDEQDRERITRFCFKGFYPIAKEIEGDLSVSVVDGGAYQFNVRARFEGEAPTDKMKKLAAIVFRYAQSYGDLSTHYVSEQWDDDPVVKCWYWDREDLFEYQEYERW